MFFHQVIGHQDLKTRLIREVEGDRVAHAKMFVGESGYGGLPLAMAFAQYLLCENRGVNDSCGKCPSCIQASKLEHPDIHFSFPTVLAISKTSTPLLNEWREIVLEKNGYFDEEDWRKHIDVKSRPVVIGTDESQSIVKKLSLKAFGGKYKVLIVWLPELMNASCANKLLKLIEEPPKDTVLLFVSESTENIMATILSRVQITDVPKVDKESLEQFVYEWEKEISDNELDKVVAFSDGNIIRLLHYLEEGEILSKGFESFVTLMRVCYKKDVLEMIRWSENMAKEGKMMQQNFLLYALQMFRRSILMNYVGMESGLVQVAEQEKVFLDKFSKFITNNNIDKMMESFDKAHYHLERNGSSVIIFTNLCFQVMRFIHYR